MNGKVHLKITIQGLSTVGLWSVKFKNEFLASLYRIYFKITLTIYVVFVFSQFIEMYAIIDKSLEEISFLLGIILLYTMGLVKVWIISGPHAKKLIEKIKATEENILKTDDENVKKIYGFHVNKNHALDYLSIFVTFVCDAMFWVTPVFTELIDPPDALYDIVNNTTKIYRPRPLPIASWFPFDRYKYYKISYTWHIIVLIFIPLYLFSCNMLFLSLLTFGIGQIRILQWSLISTIDAPGKNWKIYDQRTIAENLRKCVEYHKAIIVYVTELNYAMRIFLLLDFAGCGLQVAVIGFQAAVAEVSFQLFTTVIFLTTMLMQLGFFYWLGNEILVESEKVAEAIWKSKWYLCNESIKQNLFIIIMRAQKPLTLSVGPFYRVSTGTMMTIIRTGYSYAAVMRRLYVK